MVRVTEQDDGPEETDPMGAFPDDVDPKKLAEFDPASWGADEPEGDPFGAFDEEAELADAKPMSKAPPAAPPAPSPEELAAKKAAEDKQKEKEKKAKAEKEAADAAREAELEKKKKAAEAAAAAELEKKKKEAAAQEAAEQAAAAKKKADEEEAAKKKALADADAASAAKEAMEKSSNLKLKIAHFKKCNKELQAEIDAHNLTIQKLEGSLSPKKENTASEDEQVAKLIKAKEALNKRLDTIQDAQMDMQIKLGQRQAKIKELKTLIEKEQRRQPQLPFDLAVQAKLATWDESEHLQSTTLADAAVKAKNASKSLPAPEIETLPEATVRAAMKSFEESYNAGDFEGG